MCSLLVNIPAGAQWGTGRGRGLESTGETSRFWGRPDEVEGTLLETREPLPESTVQPGESSLGHLHFPLASGIELVGSSGFCPQISQALHILRGCPSHGTQQITHVCCHLESRNRVLPSTCCGLPPSPPWPPTSSPLCVGGHRGEDA